MYVGNLLFSWSVMSDSFAFPWTVSHQAPLSMGFFRQEYWYGWPFPSPGDLFKPGTEPVSLALQAGFFTIDPPGKHVGYCRITTCSVLPHSISIVVQLCTVSMQCLIQLISSVRWYKLFPTFHWHNKATVTLLCVFVSLLLEVNL